MAPVRLELASPRSQVKHSTTNKDQSQNTPHKMGAATNDINKNRITALERTAAEANGGVFTYMNAMYYDMEAIKSD